ncbi:hypothetical protein [Nitrobacter winogradskyi]|uniref:hypothetical protein n=1 Tax=Nitrobacter winogradskyi TaxID=913 RepID=UPI0011D0E291|nr:hypothetical protein [Nitrobacter winogradskyi]
MAFDDYRAVSGFSRAAWLPVRAACLLPDRITSKFAVRTNRHTNEGQDALNIVSSQFREVNGVPIASDGRYRIPATASNP